MGRRRHERGHQIAALELPPTRLGLQQHPAGCGSTSRARAQRQHRHRRAHLVDAHRARLRDGVNQPVLPAQAGHAGHGVDGDVLVAVVNKHGHDEVGCLRARRSRRGGPCMRAQAAGSAVPARTCHAPHLAALVQRCDRAPRQPSVSYRDGTAQECVNRGCSIERHSTHPGARRSR